MIVTVPVSVGELLDKMSILRIKLRNFKDAKRKENVQRELQELSIVTQSKDLQHNELEAALDQINGRLWDIEDELRVLESKSDFGTEFVRLARAVYFTNDQRAKLKKQLNEHFGSTLVEEKEYVDYGGQNPDQAQA